jgi:hypothetical protein
MVVYYFVGLYNPVPAHYNNYLLVRSIKQNINPSRRADKYLSHFMRLIAFVSVLIKPQTPSLSSVTAIQVLLLFLNVCLNIIFYLYKLFRRTTVQRRDLEIYSFSFKDYKNVHTTRF